jgi:hypothetical protein
VQQRDLDAVSGYRGEIAQSRIMSTALGGNAHLVDIGLLDIGRRAQMHDAGRTVDNDVVTRFAHRNDALGLPHRYQPQ